MHAHILCISYIMSDLHECMYSSQHVKSKQGSFYSGAGASPLNE